MYAEKPQKNCRKTVRMTEETLKFIESFGGKKQGDKDNFSCAFQVMVELFSGQKVEALKSEVARLERRIATLTKEESELYQRVTDQMRDATWKLSNIQRSIDTMHKLLEQRENP